MPLPRARAALIPLAWLAVLSACSAEPGTSPGEGGPARHGAVATQTAPGETGAELQDRAMNRVIRTVYLCQNGERLTVDFDNPRAMATVRNSNGLAIDLYQERAADGLWYRAEGHDLRGRGIEASWIARDRPATRCRAAD